MKKAFLGLLILIVCAWCHSVFAEEIQLARMNPYIAGAITTVSGGGPNTWYYAGALGSSGYDTTTYEDSAYILCSRITITTGGSLTKIGVNLGADFTGDFKVAIWDTSASPTILSTSCLVSNPTSGWPECTLGTALTVTTSQVVTACVQSSADNFPAKHNSSGCSQYYGTPTYASFPVSPLSVSEEANYCQGLRVYVQ